MLLLLLLLPSSATALAAQVAHQEPNSSGPSDVSLPLTVEHSPSVCLTFPPGLIPPDRKSRRRSMCGVEEDLDVKSRPHIYFCRSPNMEDFSCWWRPLENLTEEVSYVLTYSKDKEPQQECPDYVSSGPNSCHFDKKHTIIWKFYCLNVTAVTKHGTTLPRSTAWTWPT
ncbi:prolactin receptor [Dissostichus eleginoides]|uniref:Prolactin receptor n=1 Tax=Dissostichus eleginoides TaxID=100907 RepID=A0AAD9B5U4_DISEL|nr:prolactin receptor [Dissostichus eleginoides]